MLSTISIDRSHSHTSDTALWVIQGQVSCQWCVKKRTCDPTLITQIWMTSHSPLCHCKDACVLPTCVTHIILRPRRGVRLVAKELNLCMSCKDPLQFMVDLDYTKTGDFSAALHCGDADSTSLNIQYIKAVVFKLGM